MPRPIQIAMAYDPDTETMHRMALGADGSLWTWAHDGKSWVWQRMADIPGDVTHPQTHQSVEVWR